MAQWALEFDGIDDYVACGAIGSSTGMLTVEAWVRGMSAQAGGILVSDNWQLRVTADGDVIWRVTDKSNWYETAGVLSSGKWHHVAGEYNPITDEITLWIDGFAVDTSYAVANVIDAATVEMGRSDGSYGALRIAWARISSAVRYGGAFVPVRTPPWPDAATTAQWDMIEGVGTWVNNREGRADCDGELHGAAWRWDAPDRVDLWGDGYERFGDNWTFLINGADWSAHVALESVEVVGLLGSNRDTAVFRLEDVTAGQVAGLRSWQHVQVWHGGTLEFGGVLLAQDKFVRGPRLDVVCHCVDWTVLLDKRVYADRETWIGSTAKSVLKALTEDGYVPEMDALTYAADGASGIDLQIDYSTVGDIVPKLADASGYTWFVAEDEEGQIYLHFNDAQMAAPFGLSTAADMLTTMPVQVVQWSESGSEIINYFYLLVENEEGATTYSTGGTLGDVRTMSDRSVIGVANNASIATYGVLSAALRVGVAERDLYNAAFLEALGRERITGRLIIHQGGVRAGMAVRLTHAVLDVDETFLVQQVRKRPEGGGAIRYELTIGSGARAGLVQSLRTLANRVQLATAQPRTGWVQKI